MVTDDERREVARRLRDYVDLPDDWWQETRAEFYVEKCVFGDVNRHREGELFARLADLIEPHRGSGGRTILCAHCESASWCGCEPGDEQGGCDFEPSVTEGEPPYNLYSLYEAVLRRHPRDESAIEDDEVDELVDALLDICNAPGHDVIQRPQPSCDRDALLALADEFKSGARVARARRWNEPANAAMAIALADEYEANARRIREELGAKS
ncbi:hypothetical protein B5G20_02805 [Collinsella sp. An7]|uniref:hypothetical protein n=1 Tax=Collinsella sp. An7 TaxID=1965651 RepID=UPI000B3A077D|nr:hypothetical protein [Collinsella sp. An7]OUN47666.1 hypothetical protein B5G20_02805 [Collinsella sp. An7]